MALSWRTIGALARLRNYSGALAHIERTPAYTRGGHVGFTPFGRRSRSCNCMKMDPETKVISIWCYGAPNPGYALLRLYPSGRVDLRSHRGWTFSTEKDYLAYLMGWSTTTMDAKHYLKVRDQNNTTQWVQVGGKRLGDDRPYLPGIWSSVWVDPGTGRKPHKAFGNLTTNPHLVPLPTLYKHKPAWDKTLNENSPPSVHVQPKAACVHHTINREAMRTMRQQFADFLTYTKAMCSLRGWNDALDEKGDQVRSCHTDAEEYRPFFGEREANLWRPGGAYDKVKVPVVPDDLGIATIRHREDCRKFLTLARSTKPEDRYHAFLWIVSNGARSRGYSSTFTDVNVNVEPAAHRARLTRALLAVHTSKLLVATPVAGTPTHDRYNTLFA